MKTIHIKGIGKLYEEALPDYGFEIPWFEPSAFEIENVFFFKSGKGGAAILIISGKQKFKVLLSFDKIKTIRLFDQIIKFVDEKPIVVGSTEQFLISSNGKKVVLIDKAKLL